jgi:endonuclease III
MTPQTIAAIVRILKREYHRRHAPVVDLVEAQTEDPFCVLVATILSARTKDDTTAAVCDRLFRAVRKPHDFDRLSRRGLEKLIFPVGFFRTKARHLKQMPAALDRLFGGRIPADLDDLCKLPGVGRKTANLVRAVAFGKPAICVDVHVHRISNRLGLVRTRNPFETEMALRRALPVRYWKSWNSYLVSYGQTVCTPRNPRCDACAICRFCRRIGVQARHLRRGSRPTPGTR